MKKISLLNRKFIAPIVGAVILAGCVSFGAKAPPMLLVLTADNSISSGAETKGKTGEAILVREPNVPQMLNVTRVPVKISNSQIAYIKGAIWADKPARLWQALLQETLGARQNRLVLTSEPVSGKSALELSGTLQEFGVDEASQMAVIIFDATKSRDGVLIEKKRFEAREAASPIEPGPAGAALNRAANKMAADVAAWIG